MGDRPNEGNGPTYIKIGIYVYDISYINDALQTFYAKVRLVARWHDPRLAGNQDEIRQFHIDKIWNPSIELINTRDVSKKYTDTVFVDEEGQVIYSQTYSGTFTVPLNLSDFPLDSHQLKILIRSYYRPEDVKIFIDKNLTGWADVLSIPDWTVSNGEAKVVPYFLKEQNREQAQMIFSFQIVRSLGFFLWKVVIPMSLIVLMSWGVFWISADRLEARVAISATAFLTLFAFQFAIASLLPKIGYLTRMDRYTMLCYIFSLMALIETVVVNIKSGKDDLKKSHLTTKSPE